MMIFGLKKCYKSIDMRCFLALLIFVLLKTSLSAQNNNVVYDDYLTEICSYVNILHDNPENYKDVTNMLINDYSWTIMQDFFDNCINRDNLCSIMDEVQITGINDIAYEAKIERGDVPQSSDSFCYGIDAKCNYLFYECSVKKQSQITSFVKDRNGKQLLIIIPYNIGTIDVKLTIGDKVVQPFVNSHGYINFLIENVEENDILNIEVRNISEVNQSFVIINQKTVE